MNSIKCPDCALINWSTSEVCKRCGLALQAADETGMAYEDRNQPWQQDQPWQPATDSLNAPLFSGVVLMITGMLVVTLALFAIQHSVHPFDSEAAKLIGGLIGLGGILLYVVTHIWCLVRIFEQSTGWGVASFFIPLVFLIAVGQFWQKTRRSFVGQMLAVGILAFGVAIGF